MNLDEHCIYNLKLVTLASLCELFFEVLLLCSVCRNIKKNFFGFLVSLFLLENVILFIEYFLNKIISVNNRPVRCHVNFRLTFNWKLENTL